MSALDRPLPLTIFTDKTGSRIVRETISLRALMPRLRETTAATKGELPWLKLATLGDVLSSKGSYRHNENVREIGGIECDYDGEILSLDEAANLLRKHDVAGVIYSTPSHAEAAPRWRVLCPASKTLAPSERALLVARLNGILGGVLAGESFTLSQAYYFGSVGKNPDHRVLDVDGRYIDLAADLETTTIAKRGQSRSATLAPASGVAANARALAPGDAEILLALIDAMPNPEDADRQVYTAVNLAIQGCIRGLVGLDREVDPKQVHEAASRWAERWEGGSVDFDDEMEKWRDDWSTRNRDLSGWWQLRCLARHLGLDTSLYDAPTEFDDLGPDPDPYIPPAPRQRIKVRLDNMAEQIDLTESALIAAGLGLYQSGGSLVRVGQAIDALRTGEVIPVIRRIEVDETHLREQIGRCTEFLRFDAKEQEWFPIRCPPDVPRMYLARQSLGWRVPVLTGIVTAPTLRSDGSVLQVPGYDTATGLWFDPRGQTFPAIPGAPSIADARTALAALTDLLVDFPFVDAASRAVALSAIITAVIRPALPTAPMHCLSATSIGTGKSFLGDVIASIATGNPVAVTPCGSTDEELEKRLGADLMSGKPFIHIDNVDREINGPLLCQVITQERVSPRRTRQERKRGSAVPCIHAGQWEQYSDRSRHGSPRGGLQHGRQERAA